MTSPSYATASSMSVNMSLSDLMFIIKIAVAGNTSIQNSSVSCYLFLMCLIYTDYIFVVLGWLYCHCP